MKTLIISPTYNEVKNIQSLVEQIFELDPSYHLLIIDDNSPDGTAEKVKELKSLFDNLHLEERPKKAGLGTAYKFGFNWALKNGYDAVVQMDADLSHDPNDVPRLISQLKHHDLIIGSRYVEGVSVVNWPIRRLILSYGANIYSSFITGMPINDGTGGFKAWKSSILQKIELKKVRSQGYSFQIEMLVRALDNKIKIKEVPITFEDREDGKSKLDSKIIIEAIITIIKLWFRKN